MIAFIIKSLGWLLFAKIVYHLAWCVFLAYIWKGYDLIQRYGKGSWALITGSTDGIGYAFAEELVKRGFNMVLTGRNKEKVALKVEQLKKLNSSIKVKGIVVDFAKPDFMDVLREELKKEEIDISLVINNVATMLEEDYGHLKEDEAKRSIQLNCIPQALILNHYLQILNKRSKRSGVIDVSSCLGIAPCGDSAFQSGIKSFTRATTLAIQQTRAFKNVDHMCLMPGWTKTNMLKDYPFTLITRSPEEVVTGALRGLGMTAESFGCPGHILSGAMRQALTFVVPNAWQELIITRLEYYLRTFCVIPLENADSKKEK